MPWDQPDAPSVRVQLLISVSKKNWKRAVDRNRIKRLIREAYRQQKYILKQCLPPEHPGIALLLMFTAHTLPDYHSLKGCVEKILHDIGRREGRKP